MFTTLNHQEKEVFYGRGKDKYHNRQIVPNTWSVEVEMLFAIPSSRAKVMNT